MKPRIYIDTSVVGGFFDDEFKEATGKLFKRLENREISFIVSSVLERKLAEAPAQVRNLLSGYADDSFERVPLTREAEQLARAYIAAGVVGKTSLDDCHHIALATIHKADVLASWNFKHIVNWDRIKGYNSVNLKMGYTLLEIRNLRDLVMYENR